LEVGFCSSFLREAGIEIRHTEELRNISLWTRGTRLKEHKTALCASYRNRMKWTHKERLCLFVCPSVRPYVAPPKLLNRFR
jgi:hypothetical protein